MTSSTSATTRPTAGAPRDAITPDTALWVRGATSGPSPGALRPDGAGGCLARGGDWVDVVPVEPAVTALVVGDVMGHGATASAAVGPLRARLRELLRRGDTPSAALDGAAAAVREDELAPLVTAAVGLLRCDRTGGRLRLSSAGHPPPLLRWPGGHVLRLEGGRGLLLGADVPRAPDERAETLLDLPQGAAVVFYTDGLVEGGRGDIDDGIEGVARVLADLPDGVPASRVCEDVAAALVAHDPLDDVAVLVAVVP